MEIINKASKAYKDQDGRSSKSTLAFTKQNIYISFKARRDNEIEAGMYMHFAVEHDRLFVYFNDDETGFLLSRRSMKPNYGLSIFGYPILKVLKIKLSYKVEPGHTYLLKKMLSKINESLTLEVLLNKKV